MARILLDNYKYIKAGMLFGFLINLLSCSTGSGPNNGDNLLVSLQFSPEPLLNLVSDVNITISDDEHAVLFDTSYSINPYYGNIAPINIPIQVETDMTARAWFFDESRRPLYHDQREIFRAENSTYIASLEMVQSGYSSGTSVRILRDQPPWGSYSLDSVLTGMGFTTGLSGNQFSICPSSNLSSSSFHPGRDLLIISNDQPQLFYDNLAIYIEIIIDFARSGGTVLWETCDLAWNYGSYAAAGLDTLPGNITLRTAFDQINAITNPDLDLVGGLQDSLRGFYASNKYLANLADSAIIYMRNTADNPTLVGIRFGEGLIFYTGQPLEYNYDRRDDYEIGILLPRLIRFMLGKS